MEAGLLEVPHRQEEMEALAAVVAGQLTQVELKGSEVVPAKMDRQQLVAVLVALILAVAAAQATAGLSRTHLSLAAQAAPAS